MGNVIIKAAAIRHKNVVFFLLPPARHADIFQLLPKGELALGEQGFIIEDGTFVNRTEAYKIAFEANQILPTDRPGHTPTPGTLYTEDLW